MDKDGETRVKIECIVDEDEKERVWELLDLNTKEIAVYLQSQVIYYLIEAQRTLPILTTII